MNIFDKAADILEANGWCKGELEDDQGRRCAYGALEAAADHSGGTDGDIVAAEELADARLVDSGRAERGGSGFILIDWNNAPETTGEDVIRLFRELANES